MLLTTFCCCLQQAIDYILLLSSACYWLHSVTVFSKLLTTFCCCLQQAIDYILLLSSASYWLHSLAVFSMLLTTFCCFCRRAKEEVIYVYQLRGVILCVCHVEFVFQRVPATAARHQTCAVFFLSARTTWWRWWYIPNPVRILYVQLWMWPFSKDRKYRRRQWLQILLNKAPI